MSDCECKEPSDVVFNKVPISIDNFDDHKQDHVQLLTPRSLEACARQGILPEELLYRPIQAFMDKTIPETVVKLRFEHHDGWRKDRLSEVRAEYAKLLSERNTVIVSPLQTARSVAGTVPCSPRSTKSGADSEEGKMRDNMRRAVESMKRNIKDEARILLAPNA